ncbi:MAG: hypothetical protein ACRC62_06465 [Microcoleus sp.]
MKGNTPRYQSRVCLPVLQKKPRRVGVSNIAAPPASMLDAPLDFMTDNNDNFAEQ